MNSALTDSSEDLYNGLCLLMDTAGCHQGRKFFAAQRHQGIREREAGELNPGAGV